jgi:hypothetical protein
LNNLESKIVWINNSNIDKQKWDACLEKCAWGNVYALSWFLDLMTNNQWEAMVIGNYEYIMPVPFRKKFGIKYTYRPNFCQQLGVFSKYNSMPAPILTHFIKQLHSKYSHIHYPLNYANKLKESEDFNLVSRTNFLLDLNRSYQNIYLEYSDGLKKSLKSAHKNKLEIKNDIDKKDAILLHKKAWGNLVHIPDSDYLNFIKISDLASKEGLSECIGVYKDEQLMGLCILIKYKNKIYYPFSAIAPEGRKYSAVAVLIDSILKKYSESSLIFDFEGSDLASVQTFYKRFNPQEDTYLQIEKTKPVLKIVNLVLKKIGLK